MKTLLKNGVVVDGSGSNRYQADVLIDGDKIVKIGKIDAADGAEVIDVTGLVVAPGFIDTHSHSDLQILVDPEGNHDGNLGARWNLHGSTAGKIYQSLEKEPGWS